MQMHNLKTIDTVFDAVASGAKRFEVRKNDRFFQAGDTVIMHKVDAAGFYCVDERNKKVKSIEFKIGWILQGGQYGLDAQYCVFQLELL